MGALLIEAFENNEIYTLIKFILMGNQFFVSNSFREVCHYIQLQTETDAFIL